MVPNLYGVDGGGTNIRIVQIDPQTLDIVGEVMKRPMAGFASSTKLTDFVMSVVPKGSCVGVDFAGKCNSETGIVEQSPNVKKIRNKKVSLVKDLRENGYQSTLCNDMVAAVQGEFYKGGGEDLDMILVATYSSGFNCAVMVKGEIPFSPEFGHQVYQPGSKYKCGCGGMGHLEIFVTGTGGGMIASDIIVEENIRSGLILRYALDRYNVWAKKARRRQYTAEDLSSDDVRSKVLPFIDMKIVCAAYHDRPTRSPQKQVIEDIQIPAIAASFEKMFAAYHPMPRFILMGSQTNDWEKLFVPAIRLFYSGDYNMRAMTKPEIVKTTMRENGAVGAAADFMRHNPDIYQRRL